MKLSVEGIDRMYLNVYVPWLQTEQGIVQFFRGHRGQPLPSAAAARLRVQHAGHIQQGEPKG